MHKYSKMWMCLYSDFKKSMDEGNNKWKNKE